jgi:hypothetical protein
VKWEYFVTNDSAAAECAAVLEDSYAYQQHNPTTGSRLPAEQAIRYWMRAPVITVACDAPLSEALALMRADREHLLVADGAHNHGQQTRFTVLGTNAASFWRSCTPISRSSASRAGSSMGSTVADGRATSRSIAADTCQVARGWYAS